jgi:hypothetical protein
MNERIQELIVQARKYADENRPGSFVKYDPEWFVLYNEKFAELIVRECALTAGLMEHEGRRGIGAQILENFGVEE